MSSTRKTPEHILPAYSSPPRVVATAVAGTAAAAADTVALEGAAAAEAAAAAEDVLEDAAAAEVAATAAAEAAVSGLDLSRSASEPQFASRRSANLVNACAVACRESAGAFRCLSATTLAEGAKQFSGLL
jgi:hypothetical protein